MKISMATGVWESLASLALAPDPNTRFVAGAVFSSILSYLMYRLAGKERSAQNQQFLEFHREVTNQNNIKDERISQLHSEILKRNSQISQLQSELTQPKNLLKGKSC